MEKWVDILEYESIYQISNYGRVKSLSRQLKNRFGYYNSKEKILKSNIGYGGYKFQKLCKNGIESTFAIHRLVALHFLSRDIHRDIVNHKDLNKTNNHVDNLEWCTCRENVHHYEMNSNRSSKYIGVSFDKNRNKWTAKIKINRKTLNLGRFNSEIEANNAYVEYFNKNFKDDK